VKPIKITRQRITQLPQNAAECSNSNCKKEILKKTRKTGENIIPGGLKKKKTRAGETQSFRSDPRRASRAEEKTLTFPNVNILAEKREAGIMAHALFCLPSGGGAGTHCR